jgi:hypothetical protein
MHRNAVSGKILISNATKLARVHLALIFPVVLCGCEAWSLTIISVHKLRI